MFSKSSRELVLPSCLWHESGTQRNWLRTKNLFRWTLLFCVDFLRVDIFLCARKEPESQKACEERSESDISCPVANFRNLANLLFLTLMWYRASIAGLPWNHTLHALKPQDLAHPPFLDKNIGGRERGGSGQSQGGRVGGVSRGRGRGSLGEGPGGGSLGNGSGTLFRAYCFGRENSLRSTANSASSAKNSVSVRWHAKNRLRGAHCCPRNSVRPKKLTELGVWNRPLRNRICPVSESWRKPERTFRIVYSVYVVCLVLGGLEDLLETYFVRCGGVQIDLSSN